MMTKRFLFGLALISGFIFSSCIHQDFDAPPAGGSDPDIDPALVVTIADLKALYTGGDAYLVTDSIFIKGVVIADDKSGNYYQTMVIQDESAGIAIRLETTSYFNIYPVGRRVFILMKGLSIGQYNGLIQLGFADPAEPDGVARIPNVLVPDYIIPGKFGEFVAPAELTIEEVEDNRDALQNTLIKLTNVEFNSGELGDTYATDPDISSAVNRTINDCFNNEILLRNSSYAEFALEPIPDGNGSLIAVFSVFGSDNQMFIRDISDVDFTGLRCSEQPIECNDEQVAVSGLLETFSSAPVFDPIDLNNWQSISVVGSEPWEARSFSGNTYAQVQGFGASGNAIESWMISPKIDLDEAEEMSFESKIGFWKHDGLKVFISTDFDGCNVGTATWTELTDAVIANSVNSPDGISSYAEFFVNSGTVDLSAYSGTGFIGFQYIGNTSTNTTTYQVDNVQIGTPPPVVCDRTSLNENFETISTSGAFELECWQNVTTIGSEKWDGRSFSNNKYAQISGFNSPSATIETYLITPPVDLSGVSTLNFDTKAGFCNHSGLKVYISTDFDGVDIAGATWTELSATIASTGCATGYASSFTNSGDVDISSFSGTGYFAFVYRGNNTSQTTTYQVDNVMVD